MSEEGESSTPTIVIQSTRFGELIVPESTMIQFPGGLIGFPRQQDYVMIEHKPPFSWLQCVNEPSLAFVVIDGFELGNQYDLSLPFNDKECDFHEDDEFAILVIVTVRSDPRLTTANVKAPLFVNVRNRKGVQVIYDDAKYSTRQLIWSEEEGQGEGEKKE